MKAITLYQPWASLIADRRKPEETRPRKWMYVGAVAIHAGNVVDREACVRFGYNPDTIVRSAIVCLVYKTGCVQFPHSSTPPNPYGDFTPGRYGYPFDEVLPLVTPIASRGWQGVWEFDTNLLPPYALETVAKWDLEARDAGNYALA